MMSNGRATLQSIFGILFILSITVTAFAQQEQQSDTALSQSQFIQIIDRIDKSEEEMRKHIDERFDALETKFDALETKFDALETKFDALETKFHELDKKVAVLNTKVNILIAIIVGIFTLVVAPILVLMLRDHLNQRNSAEIAAESKEESAENVIRRNLTDNQRSEAA